MKHAAAILLILALSTAAQANEEIWALLKQGGVVVLMRHTLTTPGMGDPPGMKVDDCATQRNLTDEGRAHAKAIGEAWRAHRVKPDRVVSSPMCRCTETARLAFGRVDESQPVTNARVETEMPRQVREMRSIATTKQRGVIVMVSHGTTISNLTGVVPEPGEMLVVVPKGDGQFELKGRLAVRAP